MKLDIAVGDRIRWTGRSGSYREYSGRVVQIQYRESDKLNAVEVDTDAPDDSFTFSMTEVVNEMNGRPEHDKWCYGSQIIGKVD